MVFLAASQDVAVDGWSLTMLREENLGLAFTANMLGQLTGILITSNMITLLNSTEFCNAHFYSEV
jgi:PAT family acetyl-CoA transporter-like MFS transporter 1